MKDSQGYSIATLDDTTVRVKTDSAAYVQKARLTQSDYNPLA